MECISLSYLYFVVNYTSIVCSMMVFIPNKHDFVYNWCHLPPGVEPGDCPSLPSASYATDSWHYLWWTFLFFHSKQHMHTSEGGKINKYMDGQKNMRIRSTEGKTPVTSLIVARRILLSSQKWKSGFCRHHLTLNGLAKCVTFPCEIWNITMEGSYSLCPKSKI